MSFVHLHAHSEMSALDGLSTPTEMVAAAVADGQTAIAITDHGTCFPAGTRVRLANGSERPIEQVRLLDEVLTAEGRTGRVRQTMVREADGLVRLVLWGHSHLTATPKHPVLTTRGYVPMGELTSQDWVAMPSYLPVSRETITTAEFVHRPSHRLGAGRRFAPSPTTGVSVRVDAKPLPDKIELSSGMGRLVGLFLAEGSCDESRVVWSFALDERDTLVSETVQLLQELFGLDPRIVPVLAKNVCRVVLYGRAWSRLFSALCGDGAGRKRLHPQLCAGSGNFLLGVLTGWLDGDGHWRRGYWVGTTISPDLALGMFDIAQGLGMRPSLRQQPERDGRRSRWDVAVLDEDRPDDYRCRQELGMVWRKVRWIEPVPGVVEVYNLSVQGDESYVAEGIGVHNCAGHPDFQIACEKGGIKPILGMEAYFVADRTQPGAASNDYWHLVLLAMNDRGLKNLWAMSSESYRDGMWHKPRIDWDTLTRLNEGVIATTACLGGPVLGPWNDGDEDLALANLARLQEIFGDRLYVEIHVNHLDAQLRGNDWLVEVCRRTKVSPIAVVDAHYPCQDDQHTHRAWLSVQTNNDIADDTGMFGGGEDYHLMTEAEVRAKLHYLPKAFVERAVTNTVAVADRCNATIAKQDRNPVYSRRSEEHPDPVAHDNDRLLDICLRRWEERTEGKAKTQEVYMARFEREYGLIVEKGFSGYFLMVWDQVSYAKKNGILTGPCRGSGGGSLIAYLLGITELDPVEYDVLFERFMTKGRTELPDFDIDYPSSRKREMFAYLEQRWGADHVATVGTHMRLKSKSAFQSVARAIKSQLPAEHWTDVMAISAIIDAAEADTAGLGLSWRDLWDRAGDELEPYRAQYPELFALTAKLHGRLKTYGKHPAGVIIDPDSALTENLPLRKGDDGQMIAQFDLQVLELLGYVKFDMLNLSTLDILQACMDSIHEHTGRWIEPYGWREELEDPYLYEQISDGNTLGLFQIETQTGTQMCRRYKPTSLREMADVVTLVRPGPSRSGLTDLYLRRRNGEEGTTYADERMEEILSGTQGTMIYQEQLMQLAMSLAGYDDVDADRVRKILGKKLVEKAKLEKPQFLARAVANGTDQQVAEDLWAQMEEFALYCLSGDTQIHLAASGSASDGFISVAELYRKLHSRLPAHANAGVSTGKVGRPKSDFAGPCVLCGEYATRYDRGYCVNRCAAWYRKFTGKTKGLFALSYYGDGRIRPARILDVVENGEQELFRITLVSGKHIDATANHRHLTNQGYRRVRSLSVGDGLIVDAGYQPPTKEEVVRRTRLTVGDRLQVGTVNGAHGQSNWGYVDGGHARWKQWRAEHPQICAQCGTGQNVQLAHLDGNHQNNVSSNYSWLCQPCHLRYDYAVNDRRRRWQKGHLTATEEIVSIESVGVEMTYDVVMDAPHNFVANGIVTHNSFGYSHACGYAMLTMWTAWFKGHYPLHFIRAALSTVDADKIPGFIEEARRLGYQVLPPDINQSGIGFALDGSGLAIRYGLDAVKGVGPAAVAAITEAQPYTSFEDFLERKGSKCNMGVVKTLAKVGAFDSLVPNRRGLEKLIEHNETPGVELCEHRASPQEVIWLPTPSRAAPQPDPERWALPCGYAWDAEEPELGRTGKARKPKAPPKKCTRACRHYTPIQPPRPEVFERYTDREVRAVELDMLGAYLSSTPFDTLPAEDRASVSTASEVLSGPHGSYVVAAVVKGFRPAKKRTDMGFLTLTTERGELDCVVFPTQFAQYQTFFRRGLLAYASLSKNDRGQALDLFMPID